MAKRIFVTGASGFIAKHVVLQALMQGHVVVGSLRSLGREAEVRTAVAAAKANDRLNFVALDLTSDTGWTEAMAGCDALIHTASPFPLASPKDEAELIRPAVDGTIRALKAAQVAGISRVVLTSSVAAIGTRATPEPMRPFDETDWSDLTSPLVSTYARSKTLAEQAAWEFARANSLALTTIHPSFVLGAPLDDHFGSSIDLVKRMLRGKDPMVPRLGFSVVDVGDVARAHVLALERDETAGERIITASDSLWFVEMTRALKAAYPDRRIPTREAPKVLLRVLALFDKAIAGILPSIGRCETYSNAKAKALLGMNFAPARTALLDAADYLVRHKLV